MMYKVFLIAFALLMAYGCSGRKETQTSQESEIPVVIKDLIVVYGKDDCGICSNFKEQLDQDSIEYTFIDLEADAKGSEQMITELQDMGFKGEIHLPVVSVNGKMMVNPSMEEFKGSLHH